MTITKIWDIIDKIQPGVEITEVNEARVKFPSVTSTFRVSAAIVLIATAAAFVMPVPTRAGLVSAARSAVSKSAQPPPLASIFGVSLAAAEGEDLLLDRIENARRSSTPAQTLRLNVLETNQNESLKQPPSFTKDQIAGIIKKRRA